MRKTSTAPKAEPTTGPGWFRQAAAAAYCGQGLSTFRRDYTGKRAEKQARAGGRVIPYYKREWLDAWMESFASTRSRRKAS